MIQAFRRNDCKDESIRVKLQGVDPDATYTLTNLDVVGTTERTGRELRESGLSILLTKLPGAAAIVYKKKP